ncbi:GyrI-like domain-containing protein [Anaerosporobacter faecicola]|uniref:GyrI-like domain-containing protein n=1 Tax=Anaerosporobacter faecicola TaxID=2718714 RepID=UPI00143B6473|nr:GyrI-like domain-containing protein [Anaerosporobacter faecicola]
MEKYELDQNSKILYKSTRKEPFLVEVPSMHFLMMKGEGHPAGNDFQIACEALFTLSYVIKFEISRKLLNKDYAVSPMEVSWYLDKSQKETQYTWTMMIRQPDFITEELVQRAMDIAREKGKCIAYDRVIFDEVSFGTCIQCFHLGDYNKMNDTLAKMHAFAKEKGLACDQYTHDIYLNDMRKTKVENYKTIMRVKTYEEATVQ